MISKLFVAFIIPLLVESANQQQQKRVDMHQSEIQYRDSIGLKYGENTETLTFAIHRQADFLIKTLQNEEVKGTMHTYWQQNNVYISSEYREGENLRVYIYEDNYRILQDRKFYVTTGFKFNADKGKTYTIRIIDEGRINKLVAMQLTKSLQGLNDKATTNQYLEISNKIQRVQQQIKSLFGISEFGFVMHEKNSVSTNHATCIYMTYLLVEALIIVVLVSLQIRYMGKLLNQDSVV